MGHQRRSAIGGNQRVKKIGGGSHHDGWIVRACTDLSLDGIWMYERRFGGLRDQGK